MSNTFLTVKEIAREALLRLRNALVMVPLVYTDYSGEYAKKGDTILAKVPASYTADEFDEGVGIVPQDIAESSVEVQLDTVADVSVKFGSKERALNLASFADQILVPAMEAIAQKIDGDILGGVYKNIPYFAGTSGVTPDDLEDIKNGRVMLNKNKAPMGMRRGVWNPDADGEFSVVPAIVNAEKSGSTQALREGSIGRIQGIDNFMSQNVATHVAGEYAYLADVTAVGSEGDTTVALTSAAGTSTKKLLKGDLLVIGGYQYVITADTAAAVAGVIAAAAIYPALQADAAAATTTFPDVTAKGHVANLVFHRNAFAFVQRPLEPPMGGAESYSASFEGLTVRVTVGYDMDKKQEIASIDILYGIKTLQPELAVRILG